MTWFWKKEQKLNAEFEKLQAKNYHFKAVKWAHWESITETVGQLLWKMNRIYLVLVESIIYSCVISGFLKFYQLYIGVKLKMPSFLRLCNMFMNLTSFAAGEGSNILQKAKLTAVALRECNVTYLTRTNKYLQSTQICAADKKSDTCQVIFTALNFTNLCIFWNFFRECYKLKDIWNIP